MIEVTPTPEETAQACFEAENLNRAVEAVQEDGFVVINNVVDHAHLDILRERMEADLVKVKGKTEPVRIFTLLGEPELAKSAEFCALREAHEQMLAAYRDQDWDGAERSIAKCRELYFEGMTVDPDSALRIFYDVYAERVAEYRAAPPGEDWDGVFTATSK